MRVKIVGGLLTILFVAFELLVPMNLVSQIRFGKTATETPTATAVPTIAATETIMPFSPTALPQSAATPTFTPTPSPTPAGWDHLEPNDTFEQATVISIGANFNNLTLYPVGDKDYFIVFLKAGQIAAFTTFVSPGADTLMKLYSEGKALIKENDDKSPTDLGSQIVWQTPSDQWVYIEISSAVPGFGGTYSFAVSLESPTPTPTPPPTHTPAPTHTPVPTWTTTPAPVMPDQYEPNNSFDEATELIQGSSYNLTLPRGDIDYFRFIGRQGIRYRCDTNNLSGVDTAMSVYDGARDLIGTNDNRSAADIGSAVEWVAAYTGNYYISVWAVIGQGGYTLICTAVEPPPPPSGGGGSAAPTATPTMTPEPTSAPVNLTTRLLYQVNPTATPSVETLIRVRVAYDANNNRTADLNEGIRYISVRALSGSRVVGWALTDERGEATLRILGEVDRVSVPYLSGWESRVRAGEQLERVILVPAVPIPVVIPIATSTPVE